MGFHNKEWPLPGCCAYLGHFLKLSLFHRPLAAASLPGSLSALCPPAFKSDHGLSVPWSFTMQGEELLKAVSRVWRAHACPFQMLTLSHTLASAASAFCCQTPWAAVGGSVAGDFFNLAFLRLASCGQSQAMSVSRFGHFRGVGREEELRIVNKYDVGWHAVIAIEFPKGSIFGGVDLGRPLKEWV